MTNHYHWVVETPNGNVSKGMRQLNGVYTPASNRRHRRVGHLFQGRHKAIRVDKDSYLLELSRYVVLNPVRAGMVEHPGDWPWSRFRARVGDAPVPGWLATDWLLDQFVKRRTDARRRYRKFVAEGGASVWSGPHQQIYLADDSFAAKMQEKVPMQTDQPNIPRAQRRRPAHRWRR